MTTTYPVARGAFWQHVILTRAALARDDLKAACERSLIDPEAAQRIEERLSTAEEAATPHSWRLRSWVTGSAVNRAYTNLHAGQVMLARYAQDDALDVRLLSAMTRMRATLPANAVRRQALEEQYRNAMATGAEAAHEQGRVRRWILEKAMEWSFAATDAQYARLRSFRNTLVAVSVAVFAIVAGLAVMGFGWPESMRLCFDGAAGRQVCPTGAVATGRDALIIAVLGATGGSMAAVLAVRRMQGTSTPYGVPLALAMLKLPFGALSALVGLMLIHGQFVPGLTDLDTSGQILAYAVILGVAQQALTAMIDRRGQELLDRIPSKRGQEVADAKEESLSPAAAKIS
ncbi:hypothetical protein [Phytohabitans aurantiacus]|uniref:Uncharacterized protein n=1 Tax=Phytohabitans aurantiacus TaxID=3016789 RepID=A0ABQ5QXL3_9ACTN|nr:hypothetical protein [Phytohabitans aurantiacus]GLH99293.1 hypothetical protein Pa4123_45680 [Phytohabitans aurantiacus]